jgi:CDP-glycerol glycerophosphotransferase
MNTLKRILHILLRGIDLILQLLITPVGHRICYASIPDYTDNAHYLFLHALRTRRNLEHVWIVQDIEVETRILNDYARLTSALGDRGHRVRVHRWHSLAAYWAFLRSRCVAHTHGLYNFSRAAVGRVRLGLWHGMPIKCIGQLNAKSPNPYPQFASHYFATSYFYKYVLAEAFGVSSSKVLVTGMPRNDALVFPQARSHEDLDIRRHFGIKPQDKIIIWLPTYRAESRVLNAASSASLPSFIHDIESSALNRLIQCVKEQGCVLIVKLHSYEKSSAHESLPENGCLRVFTDQEWRATGIQLYDLLGAADALISDVSSVIVDFAITGRPMACFGFNARTYQRDLIFPIEYLIDSAGIHVMNSEQSVREFIEHVKNSKIAENPSSSTIFLHRHVIPASEIILSLCFDSKESKASDNETSRLSKAQ